MTAAVFWLFGLPAAGKSTLGRALHDYLGPHACTLLDADIERRGGVLREFGWSPDDRIATIRALAEAANPATPTVVTLVTPTTVERTLARQLLVARLHLIYLHAPEAVCRERDRYRQVHAYQASPPPDAPERLFESPDNADLSIETTSTIAECVNSLIAYAKEVACVRRR